MRVSEDEQNEDLQIDALKQAGCEKIYKDHGVSGSQIKRTGLDKLFKKLTNGDTLVVWKLDRLGRSTSHLFQLLDHLRQRGIDFHAITQGIDTTTSIGRMLYGQLAVFAEFEREQIRERTKAGMAAAKKRGKHIGRPRKLNDKQVLEAKYFVEQKQKTITSIAKIYGVSTQTLSKAIKECNQIAGCK
ncbi:MAG: recombinase family protein [Rhizobiales bacterium]|nr:recombinase family protein [Hyphomicrobiales bacterium]